MGGLVSGVPCSMFELVMVQQQNNGRSIPGALGHLVKTHGLFALTRGMIPTLVSLFCFFILFFPFFLFVSCLVFPVPSPGVVAFPTACRP